MGNRQPAFTLIELILVMAIITVLTAMAVPRYTAAQQHYRADAAAQRLVADLAMARSRANSTSTPLMVVFNVASSQYQMPGVPDLKHSTATYTVPLGGDPYKATLVSADFAGTSQVTFDGYGVPNCSGTVVVRAGGFQRTVTLDANSGKATWQ